MAWEKSDADELVSRLRASAESHPHLAKLLNEAADMIKGQDSDIEALWYDMREDR